MACHDDISWEDLRRIVRQWAGSGAELVEVRPLTGGSVNTTLLLATRGGDRAVLKIAPHRVTRDFCREAHQLSVLRGVGLPVPQVYRCNVGSLDDPNSYVLLEYVEGINLAAVRREAPREAFDQLQHALAELVVKMHGETGEAYGRVHCDDTPMFSDWPSFFRTVYEPIRDAANRTGLLPKRASKTVNRIHDRLDRLLDHGDRPRLVHFDLWSNNVLCSADADGNWQVRAVIDPNCKYAHAEAEIAYMDLFGTTNATFARAYGSTFKLGDDYHRRRKIVYQLYPMLDHLQAFGREYLKPCLHAIDRAAALV